MHVGFGVWSDCLDDVVALGCGAYLMHSLSTVDEINPAVPIIRNMP